MGMSSIRKQQAIMNEYIGKVINDRNEMEKLPK